ncbi:acetyl-CoA carboxylase biotin carboxylase subunit/propionyl-CoA carboxylase alpha chain [Chitinophaga skermanii]|uniref:Acetyl-CoA carboxylase biotin carboxylase subunit/propionyl-CoA carboxylase alpha chain n=1 Tax=Chitinophaga skermanii TaxID=331697 RepID=A0A327QE09_9BACT|nr:acetyl-CoA carboxylase biotin carboxylase subunit [Chitinophaga skermanii]RAI99876.1 acetyl-CoA carboxylase biotin carboxylase subunit/propionyl-CoA carboxylase alpha chain [Chitinophaga skermanii]
MKKILVANRGEIALRVMRSARELGIKTVAVFSEADRTMPFVQYADEAVCIGPAPSAQSYLLGGKIIEVAKQLGVDAIHPGYGFLSENAQFAQQVTEAGITFIGPSAASIETMGSKLAAKQAAQQFGVPMVPGTETPLRDLDEAREVVKRTGFPILVKASAGGGGKGMRIVENENELEEQIRLAKSEAKSAFGDDAVFIEKYVAAPRHIEIQILGDQHGNYVYLFERECSIQRRHQKLIEEAPSSVLTADIREAMGNCAVDVARACNYYGAGTVEFLVDEQLNFYFLEMNTRLQVEHPVTEMITGLDLVKEQINIARGEKLTFSQNDLKINGHAIELRICAEDPANNFLPDTGSLQTYIRPQGYGVRVDDGYEEGMTIPIFYDPMIAKLIAWGSTREEARKRLIRAIGEYQVKGIRTTLPFGEWALQQPQFIDGNFDTGFIGKYFTPQSLDSNDADATQAAAILAAQIWEEVNTLQLPVNQDTAWSKRQEMR